MDTQHSDLPYNAQIMGKKLLAKIATQEQKPTVFCPVNLLDTH